MGLGFCNSGCYRKKGKCNEKELEVCGIIGRSCPFRICTVLSLQEERVGRVLRIS